MMVTENMIRGFEKDEKKEKEGEINDKDTRKEK